jgi:hypothetical protein
MGDASMENTKDLIDLIDYTEDEEKAPLSRRGESSFYDPYVPRPPRGPIFNISSNYWVCV